MAGWGGAHLYLRYVTSGVQRAAGLRTPWHATAIILAEELERRAAYGQVTRLARHGGRGDGVTG